MTEPTIERTFIVATTNENPVPPQDLTGIISKHLIYTYGNGWQYEMYIKNATTVDYRIHSGHVGGRWVKGQTVDLVVLAKGSYKISWHEPTGSSVCVNIIPTERMVHGMIFFPHWIKDHGQRTVVFQNDHLEEMRMYRDQGPTYPIFLVTEFARISFLEDCGPDDETVICLAPDQLPAGYAQRLN